MSSFEYRLPDVGEGLDQAEIIEWKVEVGTSVVPDQVLAEVETDKSVVEVPCPVAGTITSLSGQPGDVIEVGAIFVEIALAGEAVEEAVADGSAPTPTTAEGVPPTAAGAETGVGAADPAVPKAAAFVSEDTQSSAADRAGTPVAADHGSAEEMAPKRVMASPATRKLALALGVDLQSVTGSGPAGRVTKDDVQLYAEGGDSQAPSTAASDQFEPTGRTAGETRDDEVVPLRSLRRQIAKNMTQSWQTVPHITDFREIDATALVASRTAVNDHLRAAGREEKITYLPFLVRAVAIALAQNPKFNASVDMEKEQITYFGERNIGLAVSTDDGLFVPVLKGVEALSLVGIARDSQILADRARARKLTGEDMARGTFTITNFGSYGGWLGTPIIRPPEAAIAGFGKIAEKVVPVDGAPAVRQVLPIAVSADHRVIDGADMGQFLGLLTSLLENPVRMMAEDF